MIPLPALAATAVSWKLRLFLSTGFAGQDILIKRHPPVRVADKAPG
jgi:hypothetical protein